MNVGEIITIIQEAGLSLPPAFQRETPEELEIRLRVAASEYEKIGEFDYLVVNSENHLDQTIADIQAIIKAEHLKTCPRKVVL